MENVYTASEVVNILIGLKDEISELKIQVRDMHNLLFPKPQKENSNREKLSVKEQKELKINSAQDKLKKNVIKSKSKRLNIKAL